MPHSPELDQIAKALCAAQASLSAATKDGVNPHFKSQYATLQSVWNAAREVLAPNGLSVVQTFADTDGSRMAITTTLLHVSGQYITGTLSMIPQRADPQGIGSAITYGRRYALAAILGIVADEDDDGNAASNPTKPEASRHTESVGRQPLYLEPTRTASKAQSHASPATNGGTSWKDHPVPPFMCKSTRNKQYEGKTLGEMGRDVVWWADNYQPKPFRGSITDADLALRKALDEAKAELNAEDVPY